MVIHWLVPLKKTGSETRGVRRQVSSCSADLHGPEQAAPAFDLNRFQSKQLFYKQHVIQIGRAHV